MNNKRDILKKMLQEKPRFHGQKNAGRENWAISNDVLWWISDNIKAGSVSLETGCGYSTVLFALMGNSHITISPFIAEHDRIREWCDVEGVNYDNVQFVASESQQVMPGMDLPELDLVLIDGDHAFPAPFIDWYYVADRIKKGGYLIVDDTQLTTGSILRTFLCNEVSRWKLVDDCGRAAIFQRITSMPVAKGIHWTEQRFCKEKIKRVPKLRNLAGAILRFLKLR